MPRSRRLSRYQACVTGPASWAARHTAAVVARIIRREVGHDLCGAPSRAPTAGRTQWPAEQWPAEQWPAEQWPAEQWPAEQWPARLGAGQGAQRDDQVAVVRGRVVAVAGAAGDQGRLGGAGELQADARLLGSGHAAVAVLP